MADPVVTVYAAGAVPNEIEWPLHEEIRVERVADVSRVLSRVEPHPQSALLDLSAIGPENLPIDGVKGFLDQGGHILADPWNPRLPLGLATHEYVASGRIIYFSPLVFHPVLLEVSRILNERILGDAAGIEVFASPEYARRDVLCTVCRLFGIPSGWRAGPVDFLWFGACGCSVSKHRDNSVDSFSITLVCRKGQLKAEVSKTPSVVVMPVGRPSYRLPLPEGDGVYYNRHYAIFTVAAKITSPPDPFLALAHAVGWVQENVREGTELLL